MNCWEFKKCGREKTCPAYPDHGTHCARMAGTLCGGQVQGLFAMKLSSCRQCDFYRSPYYNAPQTSPCPVGGENDADLAVKVNQG